jgi:tetratricopeptide (TPR) repeat protein
MADIPSSLLKQISDGKAVLVLGAGASVEAKDAKGRRPPSGKQLGELLADEFLGGSHRSLPLDQIAEYAISESDLLTVQGFIGDLFEPFMPSDAHLRLTSFRWWGLATTNYDLLIEKAYEHTGEDAVQKPYPFVQNGDRVEDRLRDPNNVMLLKLHGCVTRLNDPKCPLILTTDQYISHRKGRSRIFDHLQGWGFERPLVFVGQSLRDSDIRALLLELEQTCPSRPRYYLVAPDTDDIQSRFWEQKRVTCIPSTLSEFVSCLSAKIDGTFAKLVVPSSNELEISRKFTEADVALSDETVLFLTSEIDYVNGITATPHVDPADFYRGLDQGWAAIEQGLDVRRRILDEILIDQFLQEEGDRAVVEFVVIKAHAGAGKTVLLKRLAWEAAHEYDRICLYVNDTGSLNVQALAELSEACRERLFVFVNDISDYAADIFSLVRQFSQGSIPITIVGTERTNEWNISCKEMEPLVTGIYDLRYLSSGEIDQLLEMLEKNRALGTLADAAPAERKHAFEQRAGRQLLVALHEATLGKPFEDIVFDEYDNLVPLEAKQVYLTICALNRFNVPVRAGIVARVHGVPFAEFKERLFEPLERVVQSAFDKKTRDYVYRARHTHIAQIVFETALQDQEKKFEVFIGCLKALNLDYQADRVAFGYLVRGRELLAEFPNREMVEQLYSVAFETGGDDHHLFHQYGLYEMHRPNGNLSEALRHFEMASDLAPWNKTITHSISEVYLEMAKRPVGPLKREALLQKAAQVAQGLTGRHANTSHGYHTLLKIELTKLRSLLEQEQESTTGFRELTDNIEKLLQAGLQRFPEDTYLLEAESQFAEIIADSERALKALADAFEQNPRSSFVALRLSRSLQRQQENKAAEVLRKALEANPNSRSLHFEYAKLLNESEAGPTNEKLYHLKRAFTPGDQNYQAQLLYARELYLHGEKEARIMFSSLGRVRMAPDYKHKLQFPLPGFYTGRVSQKEITYCCIDREGLHDRIFLHSSNASEEIWANLTIGTRIRFRIAFTMRGANAYDVSAV